ncbi:uncharacterized protein LOC142582411 [Dermacentor variabilis]|uniref:uncharacterized protein LOC142582411 n=1 Tax=Dermacentor variabilis TaxID=34621 RepID=UPI003F5B002C
MLCCEQQEHRASLHLWPALVGCLLHNSPRDMDQQASPGSLDFRDVPAPEDHHLSSQAQEGGVEQPHHSSHPVIFQVDLHPSSGHQNIGVWEARVPAARPPSSNVEDCGAAGSGAASTLSVDWPSKEGAGALPLSVYMACLSLDSCQVSSQRCRLEATCCCESHSATAKSSPSDVASRRASTSGRTDGSTRTSRSRCSLDEPSNYTLVLKPKALKPCPAGGSVHSVHSAHSACSAGASFDRPEVVSRPGSTPSQVLGLSEECHEPLPQMPYSSPNSPIPFLTALGDTDVQGRKEGRTLSTCSNCRRSRSTTVESKKQLRSKKRKENSRAERCCSEEIGTHGTCDCIEDLSGPIEKGSLRHSLASCLGARGQSASRPAEKASSKRRFSFTLPNALLNVFRKGSSTSPSVRNSSSQTDPYPEEVVRCSEKATSPYAVRALPPLPGNATVTLCDHFGRADAVSCASDDSDRKSLDYASSIEKVKDCGWYWGPISGETAERLLAHEPDGSFVVRDSSDEHYIFSLTFKLNGFVRHVRIEHDQGNFSFGCLQKFHSNTIVDFIENAVEHSRSGRYLFFLHRRPVLGPMRVQLLHPVSRFKQVQSLQHLCRFSILKSIRRDFVDALPLPARLKAYLNTPHYYSEELADSVTLDGGALAVQSQELQSGLQEEPFSPS